MIAQAQLPEKTGSAYIIPSDFPDPDVIRVDDMYYLVSTTMHMTPGAVILRSYNLLDWEFCSYVFDELDGTDGQKLSDNKGIYGRGMWAACIRHHAGKFWVSFVANDTHKTYLYTADTITGPWKQQAVEGFYHDMSVLFDDDGRAWIVSGNREIFLTEMKTDLSGPLPGGFNDVIVREQDGYEGLGHEGSHLYKIDGRYYLFTIDWPRGKPRTENCFTADCITGPWKGGPVLSSEFGGWHAGAAQGGIVDTPDGRWYAIVFQDHGALGRIPVLVNVRFENRCPVFDLQPAVTVPDLRPGYRYRPLYGNAFTDSNGLPAPYWQWNHIHDPHLVTLSEHTLSITTAKRACNPIQAENTLIQRTWGTSCAGNVCLSAADMNDGDIAGLMALEGEYAFIGIMKQYGRYRLVTARHQITYEPWAMGVHDDSLPQFITQKNLDGPEAELRLEFSLLEGNEHVRMFFRENTAAAGLTPSTDTVRNPASSEWRELGKSVPLRFTLDQFVGVRFALFCYAAETPGGTARFSNFRLEV